MNKKENEGAEPHSPRNITRGNHQIQKALSSPNL